MDKDFTPQEMILLTELAQWIHKSFTTYEEGRPIFDAALKVLGRDIHAEMIEEENKRIDDALRTFHGSKEGTEHVVREESHGRQ